MALGRLGISSSMVQVVKRPPLLVKMRGASEAIWLDLDEGTRRHGFLFNVLVKTEVVHPHDCSYERSNVIERNAQETPQDGEALDELTKGTLYADAIRALVESEVVTTASKGRADHALCVGES